MLESNSSFWMTWKQGARLDDWLYSGGKALFPSLLGVKCTSMTLFSPSPLPHIYQSCNPVVFAERIRMCPWQRMKEKSTGIKFQCNCLLNCGLQLLKFYPWFCVTTAVMNSVWLWFSHWRHAHSELEKRWVGGGVWGVAGVVGRILRGLKASKTKKTEHQNTHWLIRWTYGTINISSTSSLSENVINRGILPQNTHL